MLPSSDEESSDNDTRLKIDDHNGNLDGYESPLQPMPSDPAPMAMLSPTKKKPQSSRKKVISHLIGTSASTLTLDDPSPIKIPPNESQFSEVKQTKSGRTIKIHALLQRIGARRKHITAVVTSPFDEPAETGVQLLKEEANVDQS